MRRRKGGHVVVCQCSESVSVEVVLNTEEAALDRRRQTLIKQLLEEFSIKGLVFISKQLFHATQEL